MAQNQSKPAEVKVSPAEYLERELLEDWRHEYDDGLIFAREEATKEHVTLNTNLIGEIGRQLKGSSCRAFSAQMRVKVLQANAYRYPDLSVACDPQFENDVLDVLINPTVLVEIASPSTMMNDRKRKWNQYRTIPSLQDYVMISPTDVFVEQRHRADDGEHWWIRVLESLEDELVLDSIGCCVTLADIYAGIELESDEPFVEENIAKASE